MTAATPETFDPARFPRKLNLGCGLDHRNGYLNVDMNVWHQPDLLADVCKLGFLPAQYYDEILAQDVLEHLPRTQTLPVLAHWNRPLKMEGKILLRVPSVLGIAELLKRADHQHPAKQEELIQFLFGTQAYTGDFHFTSFTQVLLEHYLKSAGFRPLKIELMHDWLFDATGEKVEHIDAPPVRDFGELLGVAGDEAFVRACYREILQRDPDPGGIDYFLGGLRDGSMGRRGVMEIMIGSTEYHLLHRTP
jgi:predicted SAM-dependent methyltransferase